MKVKEREEAIRLRRNKGLSVKAIATRLRVAKSSVSVWVRGIQLTEQQKLAMKRTMKRRRIESEPRRAKAYSLSAMNKRKSYQEEGRKLANQRDPLHCMGCMLYWGEGDKTSLCMTSITNCDSNLLRLFLRFLVECYEVPLDKMRIRVDFYNDCATTDEVKDFWLNLFGLADKNIQTVKAHQAKRCSHAKQKYGVCRLLVCDVRVKQSIMGAIQEYGSFTEGSWLGSSI